MTKVQLPFRLTRPLDEAAMNAIAAAHGYYGIYFIKVAPSLDKVLVEHDASRLTPHDVLSALQQFGIPAAPLIEQTPAPEPAPQP